MTRHNQFVPSPSNNNNNNNYVNNNITTINNNNPNNTHQHLQYNNHPNQPQQQPQPTTLIANTSKPKMKPSIITKYFERSILSEKSQFSYKGGEESCTYICLAAVDYFLKNHTKFRIPLVTGDVNNNQHVESITVGDIERVMAVGVSNDKQVGHTSCDEVYNSVDFYKNNLELKSMFIGKLRDSNTFKQLLKELEVRSMEKHEINQVTALVLTKPPETIAIFCDAYATSVGKENSICSWFVFDSHPRSFGKGGGFYLFKNLSAVEEHLKQLFANDLEFYTDVFQGDGYKAKLHVMFEATVVDLKKKEQVQQVTKVPQVVQVPPPLVVEKNVSLSDMQLQKLDNLETLSKRQFEEIQTLTTLLEEERSNSKRLELENAQLRNKLASLKPKDNNFMEQFLNSL